MFSSATSFSRHSDSSTSNLLSHDCLSHRYRFTYKTNSDNFLVLQIKELNYVSLQFSNDVRLNNDAMTSKGGCFIVARREYTAIVCSGIKMEKRLTFAIFLACFVIAVSDKRLANGLKGFTKMKSDVRQHFAAYRESRRVRKTLHNFRGNKENKSGSSSRIQYVHELFGLASRFLNPKMSLQQAKVSSYKITVSML